ncbi:MAG: Asp-tRNA(Asn)/Glu-tRNA(Gln) amidotransferase subunit GatA [Ruminococcaceae bacterium]|nr:Asp-tRNA(Asn)/Glu-tRNA(Gln) amidotransferase subunit GatA [Oscillospiraceae bacterium]
MNITERSLKDHALALRRGEYSAEELCEAYFSKIQKEDPVRYSAFLDMSHEVTVKQARRADRLLRQGDAPLLCGIPYAAKDNICTKDLKTTAASNILRDHIPPYDATAIELLKKQGAALLGKTNMDEFAMGSTSKSSAFKETANPKDKRLTPGGSSGGSACAVSAGLAPFALGSDTGGSVRQPASFCGCVGICPTYGAVSRYGLIAFASSLDRIGVLARSCADGALVLSAICKRDKRDATSLSLSLSPDECIGGVAGLRLGIAEELFSDAVSSKVKDAVLKAAEVYRSMGAELVSVSLPSLRYATEAYYIISSAEASSNLARYDGIRFGSRSGESASSMDEFYKINRSEGFGKEVKRRIMLGTFVLSAGSYDDYYKKALSVRELVKADYRKAFERCDLILSPTSPTTAYPLLRESDDPTAVYAEDLCTVSQSLAGIPAVSLPCEKRSAGLPIGMQLCGPALSESLLLRAGTAYEEAIK